MTSGGERELLARPRPSSAG